MNRFTKTFALAFSLAVLAGCDTGEAPAGLTGAETDAAVKKLPAQQQIDYINRSPMPPDVKAKKIAEIKAQAGIK